MALLELMGRTAKRPLADFFGGAVRRDIPIYVASGVRGNKPEEEIEHLQKLVADCGATAVKFRLGGRMSRNADSLPGRTEALIPLVDGEPIPWSSPAPALGQHTREVLRELGFSETRIDALVASGAVCDQPLQS